MRQTLWLSLTLLIRAGLWEQDATFPHAPDARCWSALLDAARQQGVTGLLLRGIAHLPENQIPPPDLRMRLIAEADAIERTNESMAATEEKLLGLFSDAGLHPLIMKGSQAAKYYEYPQLRGCGDIDIYLPEDDFEKALELVPAASVEPDGSAVFSSAGITVELHPRYYDISPTATRLPEAGTICGEILLQSAHIFKHAIGTGIGLKQLCDIARILYAADGRYDKAELRNALKGAGLLRWHRRLCSLLIADLGLDAGCCLPDFRPAGAGTLRRLVRIGGNFGQNAPGRKKAIAMGRTARKASTAASFLRRLPFSLSCAPRATLATLLHLTKGNLTTSGTRRKKQSNYPL